MGEFGNKFRQTREAKKLSLDDVSRVTKISARMLKAIEEEHFDQLPGGVFNRGFIRAYSKQIGLNEEEAVNDYLACLRQSQIEAREVLEPGPSSRAAAPNKLHVVESKKVESKKSAGKEPVRIDELPELQLPRPEDVRRPRRGDFSEPREFPWAMAIIVLVVVFGVFLWMRHSRAKGTISSTPTSAASNSVPSAPASSQLPVTQAPTPAPASAAQATAQPPNTAAPQTVPHSSAIAAPTPAAETAHTKVGSATPSNFSNTNPAAKPLTLVVRATETSWISVSADGQPVAQETLIAPAQTTIRATNAITVRVGNAAGVNFVFNGKELPPQGAEAEAKTLVFDAQGMRAPASDQFPP